MKILVTSKQYPYYGGSATNAYKLINYLRNNNYNTAGLYYNNEDVNIDPDNLKGIFKTSHNSKKFQIKDDHGKKQVLQYLNGDPDIVLCFNYYVPIVSKNTFPNSKIVYMVVGSPSLTLGTNCCINNNISAMKFLKLKNHNEYIDNIYHNLEKKSIECSDYILVDHGELPLQILKKTFSDFFSKHNNYCYYDYSGIILKNQILNKKFDLRTKTNDLIIVASNWNRNVKNKNFYKQILNEYPNLHKIVIGANSDFFNEIPNTKIIDLTDHNNVLTHLNKSKLLLLCSFFESGPNIIIESIYCKCQVLASKNIGKSYFLHDYNLTNDVYNVNEWTSKISYILGNPQLKLPNINSNNKGFFDILQKI